MYWINEGSLAKSKAFFFMFMCGLIFFCIFAGK